MTDKQIIIDGVDVSALYSDQIACMNRYEVARLFIKTIELLEAKEQECEELKKELHKNFEEKDTLHLIIDRLLEASGYDTNTASAEDFEDVYKHMRYEQQQLDQLKEHYEQQLKTVIDKHNELLKENKAKDAELMQLRRTFIEIRKIASKVLLNTHDLEQFKDADSLFGALLEIHKKISEVEDEI